jgi:hypothetical protein
MDHIKDIRYCGLRQSKTLRFVSIVVLALVFPQHKYNLRMTEYPMSVLRLRRQFRAGVPSRRVETRKWFAIYMQVVGGFCE